MPTKNRILLFWLTFLLSMDNFVFTTKDMVFPPLFYWVMGLTWYFMSMVYLVSFIFENKEKTDKDTKSVKTIYCVNVAQDPWGGSMEGPFVEKEDAIKYAEYECKDYKYTWQEDLEQSLEIMHSGEPCIWIESLELSGNFWYLLGSVITDRSKEVEESIQHYQEYVASITDLCPNCFGRGFVTQYDDGSCDEEYKDNCKSQCHVCKGKGRV